MKNGQVKIIDKGFKEILKRFKTLDKSYAKVGVLSGENYADGTNIALVAAVIHYGNEKWRKKKSWPFLKDGIKKDTSKINAVRIAAIRAITKRTIDPRAGLSMIGAAGQAGVQRYIKTVQSPPIEDITIERRRKKTSKPIVDTGQLLNSISFEVKI